jgi:uncharacterized membrane protein YphA (DoxX/SURF4 family)
VNFDKMSLNFLRYALAGSYLSAVADRFGFWGAAGTSGVTWGNFQSFTDYTASLLNFLPTTFMSFFAWSATLIEIVIGILLIVGFKLKLTSIASAGLLMTFALSMTVAYGIKAPFDYSVFTACAASLLLAFNCNKMKS